MERLKRLLIRCFDRHGLDAGAAMRLEHRFRVRAVGLIAAHVRAHVLDGQQADLEALRLAPPPPMVRGPTRFHHDRRPWRESVKKGVELPPCEAPPIDDPVSPIRHGHFEDIFCEIHRHRRSIHVGLLLVWLRATVRGNDAAKGTGRSPYHHCT